MKAFLRLTALALSLLGAACAPYVQLAGPSYADPVLNGDSVFTADGQTLPMRSWLPDGEPDAVILALHGFNDYSKSFEQPGRYWAGRGIAVYAYDQRGFGRAGFRGYWPGRAALTRDVATAARLIKQRHPGVPLYLVGESMGGAVAMVAATRATPLPVDGIVLSAPAVWGRATMNPFERVGLWVFSHTVPWLKLSGSGLNITPSDNVEMLRELSKDPLVIKETRVDAIKGLVDLMDEALAAGPYLDVPTLVLYGERDEIVPPEPTYRMIGRLGDLGGKHRVAVYPNGYHLLMRDLQARVVLEDVATWVLDQRAPLPSGAEARASEVLARWNVQLPANGYVDQGALPMVAGPRAR